MYKKGYTTGVFDLFHIGHLKILEQAKSQCNQLIVGVTTDECVFSYKNRYPIVPMEERIAIISSLKCVDKVVPQETMDKISAWESIKYDALFHGDDWKGSSMYDDIKKKLSFRGVDLVFFKYTEHTSTTALKKKIYQEELELAKEKIK